jgi:hypothetical protein
MASVAASAVAPFDVLFVSSGGASREERARAALRSSAVPGGGWGVSGLIVWGVGVGLDMFSFGTYSLVRAGLPHPL